MMEIFTVLRAPTRDCWTVNFTVCIERFRDQILQLGKQRNEGNSNLSFLDNICNY